MRYEDLERHQLAALRPKAEKDRESVHCPKCDSLWFEEITLRQFKADHQIVIGQHVPYRQEIPPYQFLRCIVCGNIVEPITMYSLRDSATESDDHCLDTLEGKFDTRKAPENMEDK